MSVDWVLSTGDVIEVGHGAGCPTRLTIGSLERFALPSTVEAGVRGQEWVRIIAHETGDVIVMREADVRRVRSINDVKE